MRAARGRLGDHLRGESEDIAQHVRAYDVLGGRGGQAQTGLPLPRQEETDPLVVAHRHEIGEIGTAHRDPDEAVADMLGGQGFGGADPPLLRFDVFGPRGRVHQVSNA